MHPDTPQVKVVKCRRPDEEKPGYFELAFADGSSLPDVLPPTMVLPTGDSGVGALLRASAAVGSLRLVEALLKAGVSCFEATEDATTSLHVAALSGHIKVYQRLLQASRETHKGKPHLLVRNVNMKRPLDHMMEGHHIKIGRADRLSCSDEEMNDTGIKWGTGWREAGTKRSALSEGERCVSDRLDWSKEADEQLLLLTSFAASGKVLPAEYIAHVNDYIAARQDSAQPAAGKRNSIFGLSQPRGAASATSSSHFTPLTAANAELFPSTPTHKSADGKTDTGNLSLLMILAHEAGRYGDSGYMTKAYLAVMARALIRAGVDPKQRSGRGCTAISMAAEAGLSELVLALADAKADVNVETCDGMTPLMEASKNGHGEVVRALCNHGANVSLFDRRPREEFTALMHAALWGHVGPVSALVEADLGSDCAHCDHENINKAKPDGFTALLLAALMGQVGVIRVLLRAGADTSKSTNAAYPQGAGLTPLHLASMKGHPDCVRALLQYGAAANVREHSSDGFGLMPLHYACKHGHADATSALLQARVEINALAGKDRSTALHFGCQASSVKVVAVLLGKTPSGECDRDARDASGRNGLGISREKASSNLLDQDAVVVDLLEKDAVSVRKGSRAGACCTSSLRCKYTRAGWGVGSVRVLRQILRRDGGGAGTHDAPLPLLARRTSDARTRRRGSRNCAFRRRLRHTSRRWCRGGACRHGRSSRPQRCRRVRPRPKVRASSVRCSRGCCQLDSAPVAETRR